MEMEKHKKAVDETITSVEGCKVHVKGTVEYSVVPPKIDSFTGTITISGGGNCPNTTLSFTDAIPHMGN